MSTQRSSSAESSTPVHTESHHHCVESLRRTPLYEEHRDLGGKIVPFAGWELPVQYSGVIAEHHAVRQQGGLFDVSHMGEVFVSGPEAERTLQYLTCNDVTALVDGKAQYNALINPHGGVVDDIIIYRYSRERFLVCVNAANTAKDLAWFLEHNAWGARIEDKSGDFGQIALQGPASRATLAAAGPAPASLIDLPYFHFSEGRVAGVPVIVARTGYTGEDGFELFTPWNETARVWKCLLESGRPHGVVPAGLGARDSLRLEACYPLHGHELADDISAVESGLKWIIKLKKGDFIGRSVLERHCEEGAPRALIGFFVEDLGIARHGDKIFSVDGREIGVVTSGTKTPTVGRALGMALVSRDFSSVGTALHIEVRGKRLRSSVVPRPFYKRA